MRPRQAQLYDVTVLAFDGVLHDLNDSGGFAGQHQTPAGEMHAIYLAGQRIVDLGTLGGSSSCARALNNRGTVVGGALTAGDEHHHAFVYANGRMRDLNDLITDDSCELIYALGINDRGHIVAIGHCGGTDRVVLLTQRGLRSPP